MTEAKGRSRKTREEKAREKRAKYLSDVATIEGGGKKLVNSFKSLEGFHSATMPIKECVMLRLLPENYIMWAAEQNKKIAEKMGSINKKEAQELLRECYDTIIELLKGYIELSEDYYNIVALWVIGTYFHKDFNTYPYLFLNAMKGSGKTRTLRLITLLSHKGILMTSPTEAVLFRTKGTLGIDEIEDISGDNKNNLRELLNASYKKGGVVHRMKKQKGVDGEEMVVEEFELYRPILMANINGMEEVLGDRCINLVLEKASNPIIIKLVEDFENTEPTRFVKISLERCRLCRCRFAQEELSKKEKGEALETPNTFSGWNQYIRAKYSTHTTHTTHTTQHTQHTPNKLFKKIDDSNISGRNLELFFPLFWTAEELGEKILDETIETAKKMVEERKHDEHTESKDVMLIDFISKYPEELKEYAVKSLVKDFAKFADVSEGGKDDWLNPEWVGKALRRLNLITSKVRVSSGVKVGLNVVKAKEKLKIFKEEDNEDEK